MTKHRIRDASWDLRVACALISLDVIDPFLSDIGFGEEDGAAARLAARGYLATWDSEDPEAWLATVRTRDGAQVADRIARLSDELAVPGPNHFSWIGLMVELEGQAHGGNGPRLKTDELAWLRAATSQYLAESDHLDQRLDGLDSHLSPWDAQFLAEDFFSPDDDDDEGARFDARSWLWALLDKRHWEHFQELLRSNLSVQDLDELVTWGNRVVSQPWRLSASLSDVRRNLADSP